MKLLFLAILALCWVVGGSQRPDEKKSVYLMFFVKGEGARPSDAKESEAVAKTHFANMRAQAERGRLVAAGPVQDPTEVRRGITVLTLANRSELGDTFKGDEFVARDIMRIEAAEWKVDSKKFNPKVDPSTIVEHRLVLLKTGPGKSPENEAMHKQHCELLASMEASHGLAVWGSVLPSEDKSFQGVREALIFTGADTAGIERALSADVFVQRGLLTVEILPLWMSKGVVTAKKAG